MRNTKITILSALAVAATVGAMLQNPLVLTFVAAIFILLATSLFGWWEIRLPGGLMQAASKTYAGYLETISMGLTWGLWRRRASVILISDF